MKFQKKQKKRFVESIRKEQEDIQKEAPELFRKTYDLVYEAVQLLEKN